jgi:hypothetical protein
MPEIPFCEVAFHPEYKALGAVIGQGKLRADLWPAWSRLVALYGWKSVLRAAEYLEPEKRWAAEVESLCRQYQRDDEAAEREAKARELRDTPVQRSPDEVRYATWAPYYAAGTVAMPRWFRELAKRLKKEEI